MLKNKWILSAAEIDRGDAELVGGKALNLALLIDAGQRVPAFLAIPATAFQGVLGQADLIERMAELGDPEALRSEIEGMELPADFRQALSVALEELAGSDASVAVRSSAVGEDAADASFAGLHDSFLFVRGAAEVETAVRKVWASVLNPRALAYRRSRGLPLDSLAVGVVVQEMVEAEKSGVVFTANPNDGDVYQVVVSALWGAGEGLVSAGLEADTWIVDKDDRSARAEIAEKDERLVFDHETGRGLVREKVPEARRGVPSLDEAELAAVVEAALAIESFFGRPQDVEFSFDLDGRLHLLQTRPVTTVEEYGPAAGHPLLWDNSNIIESYSGVTSPMTFSFIRHAYSIVYHCFCEVMGIRPAVVRENRSTFENMLGLFRGQVYYNLHNWYGLVRLFPGYEWNREFMESMMGVRESARGGEASEPPSFWRRYFVELPALLRLLGRSLHNFVRIRTIVARFENHFREHVERWSALDFSTMTPRELMALYREMEERLLWQWKAPIINDFYVMVFYGTLKKLCTSWCGDEAGSLQNDLVCGEGGIESTEPTRLLLELAAEARRDGELKDFLLSRAPEEVAEALPQEERFAPFYARIEHYLELYGFRCVDELKLESLSLKDRPAFIYQVLANYLEMAEPPEAESFSKREVRIRREAEAKAFGALGPVRRAVFRRVLANARLGVKNRENLRFARTRIYGLFRELLRALGANFAREELLESTEDIFYLTLDEVWSYLQGTAVTTDLRGLAELRRREFDRYRAEPRPDDRFETFGMPYHRNAFRSRRASAPEVAEGELRGIGCCPGVVTAPVEVLRSPAEGARLSGQILVAERTDPGWVPLYPAVSGLLIERGSILSHSAIVAREMGLPTIVGIPGLSAALESGQVVTMDGAAGTVEIQGMGSQAGRSEASSSA